MAFNRKTFQTRTLTAIVFAAVMLTGLLWNQWSFFILFSVIHFGCWWEYFKLVEKIHGTSVHRYTCLGFMLIGFSIMLWLCGPAFEINNYHFKENFSFPVSVAGIVMLGMGIFQTRKINLKAYKDIALGLVYISLCWGLMLNLAGTPLNFTTGAYFSFIPCVIVFSIWINDTMAYLVGSLIGKTPLSPVSPKKTWEGTLGGIVLATTLAGIVAWQFDFDIKVMFVISAISSIAGTFGDLLESKLKRMAGVKDSGTIMPGHGGFLDRFDSMLLATPAVWLYVYFIMI